MNEHAAARRRLLQRGAGLLLIAGTGPALAAGGGKPGWPSLAWDDLAQARVSPRRGSTDVEFPTTLAALDGRPVQVVGFMVPLEAKPKQTRFLLTRKPQDCEFCIEGGPASYIEVHSEPLKFTSAAFTLRGRLRLLRNDPSGVYYRLVDAMAVPA